mmetsp:Transcript_39341/g.84749  ORF Transcript_39341/g.84749 Transcript_39341/m.84749 type:complete len:81 (+) Transcript_39341:345-587(+)
MHYRATNREDELILHRPRFCKGAIWLTRTLETQFRHVHQIGCCLFDSSQKNLCNLHGIDCIQSECSRYIRALLKLCRKLR